MFLRPITSVGKVIDVDVVPSTGFDGSVLNVPPLSVDKLSA